MEVIVIMRILRTVLAPAILAIGTVGALVAGPVLALTTTAAPISVAASASASATPNAVIMHG
jgi:lysozyme family protein